MGATGCETGGALNRDGSRWKSVGGSVHVLFHDVGVKLSWLRVVHMGVCAQRLVKPLVVTCICGICVRTVMTPLVVAYMCGMCVCTVVTPLVVACICGMCTHGFDTVGGGVYVWNVCTHGCDTAVGVAGRLHRMASVCAVVGLVKVGDGHPPLLAEVVPPQIVRDLP